MKFPLRNNLLSMKKHLNLCFLLMLSSSLFGQGGSIPAKPEPARLVNNFSKEFPDFISAAETEKLEQKLADFSTETTSQIVIVIVDEMAGYDARTYAMELGNLWGVGQKETDNGVVILIKPTGGPGERLFFIATGKGLEAILPDQTVSNITQRELLPNFRNRDFYKGFDHTTTVLMSIIKGQYSADEYDSRSK